MNTFDRNSLPVVWESSTEEETEALAAKLARQLSPGSVVALYGNLGAGKTVFARGFARALGITEPVSSPTYTIVQEYPLPDGKYFYHLDLYRISDEHSALGFGVDEFLNDPEAFVLLEWPERIAKIIPPGTLKLTISVVDETHRKLVLER